MKNPKYLFQVYEKPPSVPPPGALFGSASICVCVTPFLKRISKACTCSGD